MSDIILDPKIYEALANKMQAGGHPGSSGINHLSSCRQLRTEDIAATVNIWNRLNVETYNLQREPLLRREVMPLSIHFHLLPTSTYQFLKWLNCLQDNIAVKDLTATRHLAEDEYKALQFLRVVIIDTMEQIINSLPQYENAKWGNF